MRIGIDIDDTITDTGVLIDDAMKKYKLSSPDDDYYNYTLEQLYKYKDIVSLYIDDVFKNCNVKKDCSEVINALKKKEHSIYIITSRSNYFSPNIYDITLDFLNKNGIVYDELLFGYENKKDICIHKKIDIMIDDNINIYNSLINTNIKPILFTTRINKSFNAVRVNDWIEIGKLIDKIN